MGRLLKNAIKDLKDDDIFCIGSKTNFFFIGTKADWEKDKDAVEQWCREHTESEMTNSHEAWERTIYAGLPVRGKYGNYTQWVKDCEDAISKLTRAQKRRIDARRALKAYKNVEQRAIMEEYERESDHAHVFLVSGTEVGRYWFQHEYISKTVDAEDDDEDLEGGEEE